MKFNLASALLSLLLFLSSPAQAWWHWSEPEPEPTFMERVGQSAGNVIDATGDWVGNAGASAGAAAGEWVGAIDLGSYLTGVFAGSSAEARRSSRGWLGFGRQPEPTGLRWVLHSSRQWIGTDKLGRYVAGTLGRRAVEQGGRQIALRALGAGVGILAAPEVAVGATVLGVGYGVYDFFWGEN